MIVEIPHRQAMYNRVCETDKTLPFYLSGNETSPLFPLLMRMWLDQSLPVPADQNQMAA